ncbi:hypothetical protein [Nitrolancea hollandica]|uniref:hypothetical protein n=1 Tax=Nitrolancea hollandica TaxID=1206749 RepID=UPI0012677003|nr:hypothetical protein [Nitrolancea hollandica]
MTLEPGTSRDVPRAGSALRRYLPHLALLHLPQTSHALGFIAPSGELHAADRSPASICPASGYRTGRLTACPIIATFGVTPPIPSAASGTVHGRHGSPERWKTHCRQGLQ